MRQISCNEITKAVAELCVLANKQLPCNLAKKIEECAAAEEQPLAKRVEEKQQTRREAIAERLKKSGLHTGIAWIPTVALLVAAIVLGLKIFSVKENTFVIPTIICAVAFFMSLIISVLFTNVFINDLRIRRTNERLSSTDEGARLEEIREYTDLYADLLQIQKDEE